MQFSGPSRVASGSHRIHSVMPNTWHRCERILSGAVHQGEMLIDHVHTLSTTIPILPQGKTRNCGPYATAMALSHYSTTPVDPTEVAATMHGYRLPFLGATLPWGIAIAVRAWGLCARWGFLGKLHDLKHHICCDRPVIVLVRPLDLPGHHFYDLHYRVLVGFRDDAAIPGGGELYFNCSSAGGSPASTHPGNVTLSFEAFLQQWRVLGLLTWYLAVAP